MKKILFLLGVILILISCEKSVFILENKYIEDEVVKYEKEEIMEEETKLVYGVNPSGIGIDGGVGSTKLRYTYKTVYVGTGEYEYYKKVDCRDYVLVYKKSGKDKTRKIYVSEENYYKYNIDQILDIKELKRNRPKNNDKKIKITKEEYKRSK